MATLAEDSFAPAHVLPGNIWPHDLNAYARTLDDPYQMHAALRDLPELIYVRGATRGQPGWVPTRSEAMRAIFMDAENFSSLGNVGVGDILGVDWQLGCIDFDAPQHMAQRLVLQPLFLPKAIQRHEETIRRIARSLLAEIEDRDGCDFMEDFTNSFPSRIFLDLANLPIDKLPQFMEWEHAFIRGTSLEERKAGITGIADFVASVIDSRRGSTDTDLYSVVVNGTVRGRALEHGEIMGLLMVMYLGGLDTVISSLGWHMRHVATDQALQRRMREDPAALEGAVDDLFRAYGVTTTRRYVREDMEFRGVTMKKGDRILLPTYLASRDPDAWDDPDRVDPDRKPRHLTFATGLHSCIGAHLARREVRVVFEEFLSRFDDIRPDPDRRAEWQTNGAWAMTSLPLIWKRR